MIILFSMTLFNHHTVIYICIMPHVIIVAIMSIFLAVSFLYRYQGRFLRDNSKVGPSLLLTALPLAMTSITHAAPAQYHALSIA